MAYDPSLAERIRLMVDGSDGISERKMFGGLAFLVNGNMAVAASGEGGLLVRVPEEEVSALVEQVGVARAVMRGRTMSGWVRVDAETVAVDAPLRSWAEASIAHARTLPSK